MLTTRGGVGEDFLKVSLEGRAQGAEWGSRLLYTENHMSVGCRGTAHVSVCELPVVKNSLDIHLCMVG